MLVEGVPPPVVLLIDDDQGTRDTFLRGFALDGLSMTTAASGREGIALAMSIRPDIIVVDLRLADMSGTEMIRSISSEIFVPWILISAFLTNADSVEAIRLGAYGTLEKPLTIDDLKAAVSSVFTAKVRPVARKTFWRGRPNIPVPTINNPRSAVERCVGHILHACRATVDLRTVHEWAIEVGVSHTSLCESCRLVGLRPHDARDFSRILRIIVTTRGDREQLPVLLNVGDRRTLAALLERAGIARAGRPVRVVDFLQRQRFLPNDNPCLRLITDLFTDIEP